MMISQVPKEAVPELWAVVSPMFEKALEYTRGRFDLADLYTAFVSGEQSMWVAFNDDKEIKGCCAVRILEYSTFRSCSIEYISGEGVEDWLEDGFTVISKYAKEMGCSRMEGHGREGWSRIIDKLGWSKFAVRYETELSGD